LQTVNYVKNTTWYEVHGAKLLIYKKPAFFNTKEYYVYKPELRLTHPLGGGDAQDILVHLEAAHLPNVTDVVEVLAILATILPGLPTLPRETVPGVEIPEAAWQHKIPALVG